MIYKMQKVRIEKDTQGLVKVPNHAYFGAQTQRAYDNYPISGEKSPQEYINSIVLIKKAAAIVNHKLGLLEEKKFKAISTSCDEILKGKYSNNFVIDVYQAGAGTSVNMNVNEVIANRANEILGSPLGSYKFIHPNDDVNMSQSTNDVIPTAIRIFSLLLLPKLLYNLKNLKESFSNKSNRFKNIIKSGRTHLQDALPITLGQEFSAYSKAIENNLEKINRTSEKLLIIGIGGTAVGTGINTPSEYQKKMVQELEKLTKLPLKPSGNLFDAMQNTADFLDLSSSLRTGAQTLIRIGNDLRLLSSGPKTGFSEITLPAVQPGSSIMPGKINPSIIEMLTMVCFQIIGFDQAILLASMSGQLELNVWLPLIANNLFLQIKLLTNSIEVFNDKCLKGIKANEKMCRFWFENGSGVAAVLNHYVGYDKAAQLVKISLENNKPIQDLAIKKGYLTARQAKEIFSPSNLTRPNLKSNK